MSDNLFDLSVNSVKELDNNNILKILENRHNLMVEWLEPVAAIDPVENNLTVIASVRVTVHDCINIQRMIARQNKQPFAGNDAKLLYDFMASHQATLSPVRF